MAFKIQEFHFGFADMENKEKRKIYSVFHMICVAAILPAVIQTATDDSQCRAKCVKLQQLV